MVQHFDYIVVGGGTAGLTVAARLSEDPKISVLVVEAGSNHIDDPIVKTPGLLAPIFGNPNYDWNILSVPQPERNNRIIVQPRGKLLGGSSGINFMMFVFPTRLSIDTWAELGNEGWGYDSLAPYFQKFTTVHPPKQSVKDIVDLSYHDSSQIGNGPIQAHYGDGYNQTSANWLKTFATLGLQMTSDPRRGEAMGAFQIPGSIDPITKTRSYAATGYYSSDIASRENLTVMTDTVVSKIIFDQSGQEPVAQGVATLSKDGSEATYHAGEVLLAAGSLMTPQILELSGIGSKSLLEKHSIPVVLDNPNVGEHLQDHSLTRQSFEVQPETHSDDILRDPRVAQALLEKYQSTQEGFFGQCNTTLAYVPLADQDGVSSLEARKQFFAANEQHITTEENKIARHLIESGKEPAVEYLLFHQQVNTVKADPTHLTELLLPERPENYISIFTMLNHPHSRGNVHISSPNIRDLPRYDPGLGLNPLDTEIVARHVRFVETLVSTEPLAQMLKPDGARMPNLKANTLEDAREIIRQSEISVFHPSGSCRMLPKEKGGVVDNRLRVHGIKGLRIVDASIFPFEPSGNIQTVVYAVAEKAADLIKEDLRASGIQ